MPSGNGVRSVIFSIAGWVKLKVEAERGIYDRVVKRLMTEYGFFEVKEYFNEADILVTIGSIKGLPYDFVRIDDKYFVGDDWIYASDSYKIAKWKVYVKGFSSSNIEVCIEPNFFACDLIPPLIITPLIGFQLHKKDLSLVHAAGVSKDGKAILFVGFGGSGKTLLTLKALEIGLKLLGDDHVILNRGQVLPFPTAISLFRYNVPEGSVWTKRWKFDLKLKSWIQKLTLGYIYPVTKAKINDRDLIAEDSRLERVILIEPLISKDCIVQEVEKNELVDSWMRNILMDSIYFYKYLCAFSYVNHFLSDYLNCFKETLLRNLGKCHQFVKISFPQNNIARLFNTIFDLFRT